MPSATWTLRRVEPTWFAIRRRRCSNHAVNVVDSADRRRDSQDTDAHRRRALDAPEHHEKKLVGGVLVLMDHPNLGDLPRDEVIRVRDAALETVAGVVERADLGPLE